MTPPIENSVRPGWARALGIDRRKLYRLLEKYAIADAEVPLSSE